MLDTAVYRAIAATPTPTLDEPLRRLSELCQPLQALARASPAVLFALGGRRGAEPRSPAWPRVGHQLVRRQPADEVRRPPPPPGPRRCRCRRRRGASRCRRRPRSRRATRRRASRSRARWRERSRSLGVPLRGLAAAVAYSRVHTGRALPGRRRRRVAGRRDDRRGDGAGRARDPPAPSARVARAPGRRGLGRLTDVLSGERKART